MTDTQIKNHEMDQTICFDVEKNEEHEITNLNASTVRDSVRSKVKQESSTVKPLRKKRRPLTGW